MNVSAPYQYAAASQTTSDKNSAGQVMSDTFMKLLVAQLKSQSPLDPLDPTQFVGQLAQFNSLSELIHIRELLETPLTSAAKAAYNSSSNAGEN